MIALAAFVAGLVFGLGLIVSGMSNPAKVLNFLDISGHRDPSLAFVLGPAVLIAGLGFAGLRRRAKPLLASSFAWPQKTEIDSRLLLGAAIFGLGWGLVGFCPGPAVLSLGLAAQNLVWPAETLAPAVITLGFVAAMLVGMALARRLAPQKS